MLKEMILASTQRKRHVYTQRTFLAGRERHGDGLRIARVVQEDVVRMFGCAISCDTSFRQDQKQQRR
jgi:hypothetical protein